MFGMQMGKMGGVGQMTLAQRIAYMFANSEPGAWYDPSDLTTLFQDSAGTTPVTAVEQPVGLMLDKSGRGNHASQATTTKRGVVSRRVNLLTKTEQFDDAVWVKDAGLVTPAAYTSPDGQVFQKYTPDMTTVTNHRVRQSKTVPAGVPYTLSFDVKAAGYTGIKLRATGAWVNFNLTTGAVGNSANVSSPTITALDDGIYRVSATFSVGASICYIYIDPTNTPGADTTAFAGDGTSGIYISAARVTLAIDAHLPYQWVNTATDYDTDPNKFPTYISFDGVDDAYQTNSIDFTGTDKMTVWAGVTKLSDAAVGVVVELGTAIPPGGFYMAAPNSVGPTFGFASRGTVQASSTPLGHAAPKNAVLTGIGDTSGDIASLRVNGVATTVNTDQGTGNYGNLSLYIGARAGTVLFFNGRIYQLIVRGAQSSLSQIEAAELYTRRRMMLP